LTYNVRVIFLDGRVIDLVSIKKPYIIENRIHIDHNTLDYSIISMNQIKMYTVKLESAK